MKKYWNYERVMFQLYLWKIGGLNAGYFCRPNQYYFNYRVKLFDLWNWLFVKRISFKDNQFCPDGCVIDINGKKHNYYYDYEGERKNPFRQKVGISYITCSPGWDKLIFSLVKEAVKEGWNKEVCQVKEKYGGLRFYINGASDKVHDIIDKYENLSYETCETCGSTENIGQTSGWVTTLCINCKGDDKTWSLNKNTKQ